MAHSSKEYMREYMRKYREKKDLTKYMREYRKRKKAENQRLRSKLELYEQLFGKIDVVR